jgi:cellulose synthase/poly-beta-1,6-N-acetylglucosamine synthase-like glycosyltransferase
MFATFVEKHDSFVHRALEMLLGLMTWALLTSPIWLGLTYPPAIVYMLTFFTVLWSFMAAKHTIGIIIGYRRYEEEMAIDWMQKCRGLNFSQLPDSPTLPSTFEDLKVMLLVPAVNESENVLRDSIESFFSQTFPTKQITLVYTIEEKYAEETKNRIKRIIGGREKQFDRVLYYVHPAGIPGEAIGVAGANRTWGAKNAVEDLKNAGENLRDFIFATIDADHVLDPQYFARVAHLYLTTDERDNNFYTTAVHLFNNNLWRVPVMMRIEANAVTLGSLSDWVVTRHTIKDIFSAYCVSLQTLIDADYWDVTLGIDDTIFYWRAFFARDGDFAGVCHYIPYSADAVEGKNFMDSHVALYRQLLRWGWGAIDFPLSVKGFMKNKKIPLSKKIRWMFEHFRKRVVLINIVFMITFGFGLVTLVNPYVKQSSFAYSLPSIMSVILTLTLIFLIPGAFYRQKIVKPHPKDWPLWKKFLIYLEGPLIILNLLTYSFIPWIDAQTRMLFGKKMKDLYHTPKLR